MSAKGKGPSVSIEDVIAAMESLKARREAGEISVNIQLGYQFLLDGPSVLTIRIETGATAIHAISLDDPRGAA